MPLSSLSKASHLSLESVVNADDCAFGAGRVPGHVGHVVGAPHDEGATIVVLIAAVTGGVVTGELFQVACQKALVVVPDGGAAAVGVF